MVTTRPNIGKTTVLEPQLHSNVADRNSCQSERLTGAVLSISENVRSKGQRQSFPHDQIWAKLVLDPELHSVEVAHIVNQKDLLGQC